MRVTVPYFSRAHLTLLQQFIADGSAPAYVINLLIGADCLDKEKRPTPAALAALARRERAGPEVAS